MAKSKQCNYCPAMITFERVNDRWVPYNIDGTAHKCGAGVRDERPKPKQRSLTPAEVEEYKQGIPSHDPDKPQVTEMKVTVSDVLFSKLDQIIFLLTAIKENQ